MSVLRRVQLRRRLPAPGRRGVHRLSPASGRQAITVAAFLVVKMAAPIDLKTEKGYYFHCPRRTGRTDD